MNNETVAVTPRGRWESHHRLHQAPGFRHEANELTVWGRSATMEIAPTTTKHNKTTTRSLLLSQDWERHNGKGGADKAGAALVSTRPGAP